VRETDNSGLSRFYGTRVTVQLASRKTNAPTWQEVKEYIEKVCKNLDFVLTLEHLTAESSETFELQPEGLSVPVPPDLSSTVIQIPVDDPDVGLKGEIVFYRAPESALTRATLASETPVELMDRPADPRIYGRAGILLRGGFAVGAVPGLPSFARAPDADARVEVYKSVQNARSLPVTDLGRSRLSEQNEIQSSIFEIWLKALLIRLDEIEQRPLGDPSVSRGLFRAAKWIEESYSAYDLFQLARTAWPFRFNDPAKTKKLSDSWDNGEGSALWAGDSYSQSLSNVIFEIVLPKITSVVVGENGNYFARPPKTGWQDVLRNWTTFVSDNLVWPIFADFTHPVEDYLCECFSGNFFINKKFESQFEGFELSEIRSATGLFEKLTTARFTGRPAQFSQIEIKLLLRFSDVVGDLTVRRYSKSYTVRELVKGKTPSLETTRAE
jgi:hypothetical protein